MCTRLSGWTRRCRRRGSPSRQERCTKSRSTPTVMPLRIFVTAFSSHLPNMGSRLRQFAVFRAHEHDPDLWTDEFAFLSQLGQADIQSDLFYDYRTNVDDYPKWQAWMREKQPRLLVIWGKYDLSFDPS